MNNNFPKNKNFPVHPQKEFCNIIYENQDYNNRTDDKNPMFCYDRKTSSFNKGINNIKEKKKERKETIHI